MRIQKHGQGEPLVLLIGDDFEIPGVTVIAVTEFDWNTYLSPWPAARVFKKGEDFSGQADMLLNELITKIPELQESRKTIIAGYSLAGLFAMYACTKTDLFDVCVSVSGSYWYPAFTSYLASNPMQCKDVYVSLGTEEAKTKNPFLQTVQGKMEEVCDIVKEYAVVQVEMNPGNHFHEPQKRMMRALNRYIKKTAI